MHLVVEDLGESLNVAHRQRRVCPSYSSQNVFVHAVSIAQPVTTSTRTECPVGARLASRSRTPIIRSVTAPKRRLSG